MTSLKLILDKNKLTGTNYKDWLRNINIALTYDKVIYVTTTSGPLPLNEKSTEADIEIHATWERDCSLAKCLVLASMDNEHQRRHEKMDVKTIFLHTSELYGEQSRVMQYETSKKLFHARMSPGASVGEHVLKLIGLIEDLADLGFILEAELNTDLILQSLPGSYGQFVSNFNMNKLTPTLPELLNILRIEESTQNKGNSSTLLVDRSSKSSKLKPKRKVQKKTPQAKKTAKKGKKKVEVPKKNKGEGFDINKVECYFCHLKGHMKRDCKKFQATLPKKKAQEASTSGVLVVENCFSVSSTAWVLDTGSGTHICNSLQGLKNSSKLGQDEVTLRVGNGAIVAAVAVGDYNLTLPKGVLLVLKRCYYVPKMLCNIISVSLLDIEGYKFVLQNNVMNIFTNQVLIGFGTLFNGIYILNQNIIFNIQNPKKRKFSDTNDAFLWHCRLGHINQNRINKLHTNGYLDPLKTATYETCHSCLKGKLTKTPFKGHGERAEELLGLIHSDVCGPMSIHAKGGYSYFITFTDDFSRYGHVFLMKHKSESFEKFVEYKNEVENQTEKSIKILRSDRGGEYLSSEFLAFLKENGILSQLTPPYTPQLNGVSERRNRTLLDMVRLMMSTAELPLSFWGYALL